MAFPVVVYGSESWIIKKAEHRRTDAFALCCWRRILRVPWTARRLNQSIQRKAVLNIHWKDWWWSWSSNTLATWYAELTLRKRPRWRKRLKAEEADDRGWDGWVDIQFNGHEFEEAPGVGDGQGSLACCSPWGRKEAGHDWETELMVLNTEARTPWKG